MSIKLATLFTDNMVIQRDAQFKVFGVSEAAGQLGIKIGGTEYSADINEGAFCAVFPPLPDTRDTLTLTVKFNGVCEYELHNVVMGEVWIAGGQSNMEMPLFTTYDGFEDAEKLSDENIRFFTVPRRPYPMAHIVNWHFEAVVSDDTPWEVCNAENSLHFTAAGFYFARKILDDCKVPVGIISCNWGGTCVETWMNFETVENSNDPSYDIDPANHIPGSDAKVVYYKKVLENLDMEKYAEKYNKWQEAFVEAAKDSDAVADARVQGAEEFARLGHMGSVDVWPDYGPYDSNRPGCLYENMLSRIAPYSVKGVLWYQGESNGGRNDSRHYAKLFKLMTEDWRALWGIKLPFIVVEIAPFGNVRWNGTKTTDWGYLREQQRIADNAIEDSALIQIGDHGDDWNIHPCNKKVVGDRLALAAERIAYNMLSVYSGPVYEKCRKADGGIYVSFTCCEKGLAVRGEKLCDFSICGSDGKFKDAEAEIVSENTVFVHSDEVADPEYVRAGFTDYPLLNLTNGYGLPASPFRTDNFED